MIYNGFRLWITYRPKLEHPLKSKKIVLQRWHHITADEYHRLLEAAPDLRWKAYYALAYTSAGRTGELFSLMWSDIDFDSHKMLIQERAATENLPPFYVKPIFYSWWGVLKIGLLFDKDL